MKRLKTLAALFTLTFAVPLVASATPAPNEYDDLRGRADSAVAELDRKVQDLIAVVLWGGALGACIWALWYAGRKYRI